MTQLTLKYINILSQHVTTVASSLWASGFIQGKVAVYFRQFHQLIFLKYRTTETPSQIRLVLFQLIL